MQEEAINEFWTASRQELDRAPLDATVQEIAPTDPLVVDAHVKTRTIYEVSLTSFGGTRIRAWYLVPAGEPPPGGWPAIIEYPPYKEVVPVPIHLGMYGFATLSLFPRGQSISRKEWQVEMETKVVNAVTNREQYYYRGAYMDCIRGLDFLCSRPEINRARIGTWGFSAGGGLSLATASLDSRVKAAVAGIPWPCDFVRGSKAKTFPFVHLTEFIARHSQERQTILDTLAYFDVVNLVGRITCPVLMGGAIEDEAHPIDSILDAFKRIKAKKSILVYPNLQHEYKNDFTFNGLTWMKRHL